jgi:hypothetical protein
MTVGPRSWTASIVGFALAVLVAGWALNRAADYLLAALPVLVPVAAVVTAGVLAWRFHNRPRGW